MTYPHPREDAIKNRDGRYVVPTRDDTKWIGNWHEFKAVGGVMNFSEDQTEITLTLPTGYKFGIQFQRPSRVLAKD